MVLIENPPSLLAIVALVSYVLGAIPFGIVITKLFGLEDVRKIGSGNIGATNVLRTGNKLAAALTLVVDMAKGWVAVALFLYLDGDLAAALELIDYALIVRPGWFQNHPRWQRIVIYLAGPVMNALLAVLLVAIVYNQRVPASTADARAWLQGFEALEGITVNGNPVELD